MVALQSESSIGLDQKIRFPLNVDISIDHMTWTQKTLDQQLSLLLLASTLLTLLGLFLPWLHFLGEIHIAGQEDQITQSIGVFLLEEVSLPTAAAETLNFSTIAIITWLCTALSVVILLTFGYSFVCTRKWTLPFTPTLKLLILAFGTMQFLILALTLLEFQEVGLVNPYITLVWEFEDSADFLHLSSFFGIGLYLTLGGFLLCGPPLYASIDVLQNAFTHSHSSVLLQIEVELSALLDEFEMSAASPSPDSPLTKESEKNTAKKIFPFHEKSGKNQNLFTAFDKKGKK